MRRTILGIALIACGGLGFAAGRTTLCNPRAVISPAGGPAMILASLVNQPEEMDGMEMGAPGEHHKALDAMVGHFKGSVRITMAPDMEPMELPGEVTREWILGGRFIKEDITSDSEFGRFEGIGIVGYNDFDGVYQSAWLENMSTAITTSTGYYEAAKKTFHFSETIRDPMSGKLIISQTSLDLSDPDRQVIRSTVPGPDGARFESFYGVFERVK